MQTLTIGGSNASGVNTNPLASGETYDITVSGFPLVSQTLGQTAGWWADAEFAEYWTGTGYPGGTMTYRMEKPYNDNSLWDVLINGNAVDWLGSTDGTTWAAHTYSPDHIYRYSVVGTGASINLKRTDSLLDSRSGSLTAEVAARNEYLWESKRYQTTELYSWDGPYSLGRYISKYPFCSMRSAGAALSIAIPLTQPRVYKFSYLPVKDGKGYLEVSFEIGLSADMTKMPSSATVDFVIYANDPAWGFRSAAENYYSIYPETFEKHAQREGIWFLGFDADAVPEPWDFGLMFDETGTSQELELKHNEIFNIYSLPYIEQGGVWVGFTGYDSTPTNTAFPYEAGVSADELTTKFLARRSQNPSWNDAVSQSACYDKDADWIWVRWTNAYPGTGPRASHLATNMDPEMPGGYGEMLMSGVITDLESAQARGLKVDGTYQDSLGFYVTGQWEDYRRSNWVHSDVPLTFSHTTKAPVQLQSDSMWEFTKALSDYLRSHGKLMIANTYPPGDKFHIPYLDEFGIETGGSSAVGNFWPYLRVMAHQKPVSWLDYYLINATEPPGFSRDKAFNQCLFWGIYPGTADFILSRTADIEGVRPYYKQWIPRIQEVGKAGWEPITLAESRTANVWVERFGDFSRDGVVYFTVFSTWDFAGSQGEISIDRQALGIPSGATLISHELTTGSLAAWTLESGGARMKTTVNLPGAMKSRVYRVATQQALSGVYAVKAGEYLHRVLSQMRWFLLRDTGSALYSAANSMLPQVEGVVAQCDQILEDSNNRPSESSIAGLRDAVADLVVLIGQWPHGKSTQRICHEQSILALEALQGSINIHHFLPAAATGRLTGSVQFGDFGGDVSLVPVRITLIHDGSPVRRERVFLGSGGNYALENVGAGTYSVEFSAGKWPKSIVSPVVVVGGSTASCSTSLTNGDLNGDQEITTTDLSVVLKKPGGW